MYRYLKKESISLNLEISKSPQSQLAGVGSPPNQYRHQPPRTGANKLLRWLAAQHSNLFAPVFPSPTSTHIKKITTLEEKIKTTNSYHKKKE
jgi:hypothetical protein